MQFRCSKWVHLRYKTLLPGIKLDPTDTKLSGANDTAITVLGSLHGLRIQVFPTEIWEIDVIVVSNINEDVILGNEEVLDDTLYEGW